MIQRVISFNFLVTVNTVISESAPLTADEMLQQELQNRYTKRLHLSQFQITQPVIGILTMPFWNEQMRPETFEHSTFIWEHNVNFVHYAGNWAVQIAFDISEPDLDDLLSQINGVFIPGGGLTLIDSNGIQHQFYKTAKKIISYSKEMKDKFQIIWPVFGICQGFQTIHHIINNDDKNTLHPNQIYNESRPINWQISNPKTQSRMFSEFPLSLINKLGTENLAFHAHDWVIDLETYKKSQQLSDFFEILATDKNEGMEFVVAVEAKNYPISGVMFHPETQQLKVYGKDRSALRGRVDTDTTDAINFYFSNWLHQQAKLNINGHKYKDDINKMLKYQKKGLTNIYNSQTLAYGFD